MNQFKRAQVIMLPIKDKALNSVFAIRSNKPYLMSERNSPFKARIYATKGLYHTYYNLYIISDDKIEDSDWYFDGTDFIHKKSKHNNTLVDGNKQAKKIIATTDTSLNYIEHDDTVPYPKGEQIRLPYPSQQFIIKYIESYNKGEVITDVLVEYEGDYDPFYETWYAETVQPKVNPKDNTITIRNFLNER